MDKKAISTYGYLVVVVIILVLLFALATPLGLFVKDNTKITAEGMMDVSQHAINDSFAENLGVTVADVVFEETTEQ
jgi:hypothetical protein